MLRFPTRLITAVNSGRFLTCATRSLSSSAPVPTTTETKQPAKAAETTTSSDQQGSGDIYKRLMSFFDEPGNWGADEVKTGRAWRIDELRIKSNEDLHRLWYVLVKERNMLMTMEEAAKEAIENMPSPERIDKVEESMKNIEEVILERNRAYWELEVGDAKPASRPKAFRRDMFGRWRWIACSEHVVPYWMNNTWRKLYGPGFDPSVVDFNRRLREKAMKLATKNRFVDAMHVRRLLKRFPDMDVEVLKQRYPNIDVEHMKANLAEYEINERVYRFHRSFYGNQEADLKKPV